MPDLSSFGDWLFNDLSLSIAEWLARGWYEAPRLAQIAMALATVLGLVAIVIGVLNYPGIMATVAIGCGIASIAAAVLIVFTTAVIRGE
jgi:hypothetical protein